MDENSCDLKVYINISMTMMQKLIKIFVNKNDVTHYSNILSISKQITRRKIGINTINVSQLDWLLV